MGTVGTLAVSPLAIILLGVGVSTAAACGAVIGTRKLLNLYRDFQAVPDRTRALKTLTGKLTQLANDKNRYNIVTWNCNLFRDAVYHEVMGKTVNYTDHNDADANEVA